MIRSRCLFSKQAYETDYVTEQALVSLHPSNSICQNGTIEQTLDHYQTCEICEGWTVCHEFCLTFNSLNCKESNSLTGKAMFQIASVNLKCKSNK